MNQTIRIIGGQYRGKKISFPNIEGLRPTPDRVRETLFNWLMNKIRGARCLDAFAGSGALGLEAFSRGASKVIFLEKDSKAYTHLTQCTAEFNSTKLRVINTDALIYLENETQSFDVIFLDPPFKHKYIDDCLKKIVQNKLLAPDGLIYLETPERPELNTFGWEEVKLKKAGQVFYGLYKR